MRGRINEQGEAVGGCLVRPTMPEAMWRFGDGRLAESVSRVYRFSGTHAVNPHATVAKQDII